MNQFTFTTITKTNCIHIVPKTYVILDLYEVSRIWISILSYLKHDDLSFSFLFDFKNIFVITFVLHNENSYYIFRIISVYVYISSACHHQSRRSFFQIFSISITEENWHQSIWDISMRIIFNCSCGTETLVIVTIIFPTHSIK